MTHTYTSEMFEFSVVFSLDFCGFQNIFTFEHVFLTRSYILGNRMTASKALTV